MGLKDLFRRHDGTTGWPTSANRASSMHLWWDVDVNEPAVSAAVTLTVVEPPAWPELCFWALQASFADAHRTHGGAHLGLQWFSPHPASTAVNFGGYSEGGGVLRGSESPLPSATGNPNTRDFPWLPRRRYRLDIVAIGDGRWSGRVDGVEIRTLLCAGDRLSGFVVWTECFARCEAAPSVVRWSHPEVTLASGQTVDPTGYRATYQSVADGGCATGTSEPSPDGGVLQITGATARSRPDTLHP